MEPGHIVGGRYEVISLIASGGMGSVYRARHQLSKKEVALKIIPSRAHIGHDDDSIKRFKREVSVAADIGHPGIVEVYDAGIDEDGSLFISMELLQGESLRERMDRPGASRQDLLRLVDALLEPLAAAHVAGVVHRDLKPENIFLVRDARGNERVKILDFGIARQVSQQSMTQTGDALGTPYYMAPEQAVSAKGANAAADVWSMGCILYEMLTGELPFDGDTVPAVIVRVCTEPHIPLDRIIQGADPRLTALLEQCLSKDPNTRPKDASALRLALKPLLTDSAFAVTAPSQALSAAVSNAGATGPLAGGPPGAFSPFGAGTAPFGGPSGASPLPFGSGSSGSSPQPFGESAFGSSPVSMGGPSGSSPGSFGGSSISSPGQFGGGSFGSSPGPFGSAPSAPHNALSSGGGSKTGLIAGVLVGGLLLFCCAGGGIMLWLASGGDDAYVTSDDYEQPNVPPPEPYSPPPNPNQPPPNPNQPPTTPMGFKRVSGDGWSIAVPSNWNREDPSSPIILVQLIDPHVTSGFRNNVNIAAEPFFGTLAQYVQANIEAIRDSATVLAQTPSSAGGRPATEVDANWPTGSVPARAIQLYTVTGTKGYVVTCMGARGTFEQLRPTCGAIFATVQFQ